MTRAADAYDAGGQTVRNVAEAIERSLAGLGEGALVEETLWPACKALGVRRGALGVRRG